MSARFRTTSAAQGIALAVCIFLTPAAWGGAKYKVVYDFGGANDGSVPAGPPLLDSNSNLYGANWRRAGPVRLRRGLQAGTPGQRKVEGNDPAHLYAQ
jgi:hypothetical protein